MSHETHQDHVVGSRRYQSLDIWRGVICLLVVLEHVGVALWPEAGDGRGWEGWLRLRIQDVLTLNIGTPMFFVISGYCIASSLESARRKGTGPLQFLVRRAWRIFPTYWAALLGFVVVVGALDAMDRRDLYRSALALELQSPSNLSAAQWLGNLTLTETWRPIFWGPESTVYTRVAWSLCYQEQFYGVCCLVLWLSPRRVFRGLAWASGLTLLFRVVAADVGFLYQIDGSFPVRYHEFAIGLLVYWRLTATATTPAWGRHVVELSLAALALSSHLNSGLGHGSQSTTAAAIFGLILIAAHRWDSRLASLPRLEPLRACGRRSFSIYLSHLPVTVVGNTLLFQLGLTDYWVRALVSVPMVMAASLVIGWAFYGSVERHFLGAPTMPQLPRRTRMSGPGLLVQPA